ncbi:uncharacterized protein O9250_008010 isoform 1-T20 [Rhynochetos jubatus]
MGTEWETETRSDAAGQGYRGRWWQQNCTLTFPRYCDLCLLLCGGAKGGLEETQLCCWHFTLKQKMAECFICCSCTSLTNTLWRVSIQALQEETPPWTVNTKLLERGADNWAMKNQTHADCERSSWADIPALKITSDDGNTINKAALDNLCPPFSAQEKT